MRSTNIAQADFTTVEGVVAYAAFEQIFLKTTRELFAEMALVFASQTPRTILDVGCGTGLLLAYLHERCPEASLVGIDPSPQMLSYARQHAPANLHFEEAAVETFTPTKPFDMILSYSNFRLWRDPVSGLQRIYEMLAPGGLAYILDLYRDGSTATLQEIVANISNPQQRDFFERQLAAAYTRAEIEQILQAVMLPHVEVRFGGLGGYAPFSPEAITLIQRHPRIAERVFRLSHEGFRTPRASQVVVHIFIRKE